jgi:hypothetical protein
MLRVKSGDSAHRAAGLQGGAAVVGALSGWLAPATVLMLAGALVPMCAKGEVRLSGRVLSENNAPVGSSRIILRQADSDQRSQASTDVVGSFSLTVPSPGEYLIDTDREGYFPIKSRALTLGDGDNEITLILTPLREVLEHIDVTSAVSPIDIETTASERKLSGTELLFVPYPNTNNLKSAMRLIPGVIQDPRGGIHVNGGTEEQVQYVLDGFNVSDPISGRFESRMSVEAVQSLEVLSGRFSPQYGKGSAGTLVVNTTTGDDRFRRSATNFVPGIENRKGLFIGNWTPRFGVSGPIRRGRAWFSNTFSTLYDKLVVEDLPKGEDRISSWRFGEMLHAQVNVTAANILHVGFLANWWNAPRTGLNVLDPPETTVDRRTRQWFFHVKDQIYFGGGALLEAGFAVNRTFGREIPQGEEMLRITPEGKRGNFFVDAVRTAARDQWITNLFLPSFRLLGTHQVKTGIDLDRVQYGQNVRRTGVVYYRSNSTPSRRVIYGGNGVLRRSNFEASMYVQDSWKVRPNLMVEFGARTDWDHILDNWTFSPRLGFAWAAPGLENTKISGGYAITYDANNLRVFTRPMDQYALTTYFNLDGRVVRGPSVSAYRFNGERLGAPRYTNWSIGAEQRLPLSLFARAGYLRKRGSRGLTYFNVIDPVDQPPSELIAEFETSSFDAIYHLGNLRKDSYDAIEIGVRQNLRKQYEWMVSYARSQALSNAVIDLTVDDPVLVSQNAGPMPWDSPHRVVSWGYLPTFSKAWALAYLLEWRSGLPFSIQTDDGQIAGAVNSNRFPMFFELNVHAERKLTFRKQWWAFRAGFNNITNHHNYNVVNNVISSPNFMRFYGGQSRSMNFRIRWLGRAEK